MQIGDINLTRDMMPSYLNEKDYPTRRFSMMQDTLNAVNQRMQMQPQPTQIQQGSMDARNNQWQGQ